jgi:ribonuclease HII
MLRKLIVGVDEVGYGAIAGPLVVGAVAFDTRTRRPVLKRESFERGKDVPVRDSKTIKHTLLPRMVELVLEACVDCTVVQCPPKTIDRMGVGPARIHLIKTAVQRLVERTTAEHPGVYDDYKVIVDGDLNLGECRFKYTAQPKADRDVWQVAAASIMAKHTQVHAMLALHEWYKKYGWDRNKGYPTPDHRAALQKHGACQHHRKSYKPVQEVLNAR